MVALSRERVTKDWWGASFNQISGHNTIRNQAYWVCLSVLSCTSPKYDHPWEMWRWTGEDFFCPFFPCSFLWSGKKVHFSDYILFLQVLCPSFLSKKKNFSRCVGSYWVSHWNIPILGHIGARTPYITALSSFLEIQQFYLWHQTKPATSFMIWFRELLRVCIGLRLVHFSGRAPGWRLRSS